MRYSKIPSVRGPCFLKFQAKCVTLQSKNVSGARCPCFLRFQPKCVTQLTTSSRLLWHHFRDVTLPRHGNDAVADDCGAGGHVSGIDLCSIRQRSYKRDIFIFSISFVVESFITMLEHTIKNT
jgi:hypothetical protein